MTLKDYDRKVVLEKEGKINEEAEEMKVLDTHTKGFKQEEAELKAEFR